MLKQGARYHRKCTRKSGGPSCNKSGELDKSLRDKGLLIRGKDQRLRKNRLVSNGDQVHVMTLDVQVKFSQIWTMT
jgi:hypothetical protein